MLIPHMAANLLKVRGPADKKKSTTISGIFLTSIYGCFF